MLRFVFQKMLAMKWLTACLLIGNVFLCSISAAIPIYTDATMNRVLQRQLNDCRLENGRDAGVVEVEIGVSNGNYVEIKSGLESGEKVYAVSKTKEDTLNSVFSSLFTQQRVNNRQNTRQNNTNRQNWNGNGGAPQMPSGGNGGGR